MFGFDSLGEILIIFGLVLAAIGVFLLGMPKSPWPGRMDGGIVFRRGNFTTYFPGVTSGLVSIFLPYLLAIFRKQKVAKKQ